MKKKVLFTASIALHIKAFHLPYLKWFQENGYETHVACEGDESLPYTDKKWNVPFVRSPFSIGHFKAYSQLKKIIDSQDFVMISCHTPMASIITRITSINARKKGCKLLYTAHGFHFFKGSPLFNWILFYPIERYLSAFADAIICINTEDFELIKEKGSKKCDYYLIPGIGVEPKKFYPVSQEVKNELRIKNNFDKNEFLLIYAAEFIARKNHIFIINSVLKDKESFSGIKIIFAGRGKLETQLQELAHNHGLSDVIRFIGFRTDIDQIYKMSDIGISSSKQEGLPINVIEEMMCGLPVIATYERGHKEIIQNDIDGYLFEKNNIRGFIDSILSLKNSKTNYSNKSKAALKRSGKFEIANSLGEMIKIYNNYLNV